MRFPLWGFRLFQKEQYLKLFNFPLRLNHSFIFFHRLNEKKTRRCKRVNFPLLTDKNTQFLCQIPTLPNQHLSDSLSFVSELINPPVDQSTFHSTLVSIQAAAAAATGALWCLRSAETFPRASHLHFSFDLPEKGVEEKKNLWLP